VGGPELGVARLRFGVPIFLTSEICGWCTDFSFSFFLNVSGAHGDWGVHGVLLAVGAHSSASATGVCICVRLCV
jgi:hypothetical protein